MKKSNIIKGVAALTILAATAGATSYALASENTANGWGRMLGGKGAGMGMMAGLTDTQRAEMQAKMDAVKAALDAGNYDAWVAAVKAMNPNSPQLTTVTAANFSELVAEHKERQADFADRQAKADAVKAAITANDYNAWVAAEKAMNENSPLLSKISADNFAKYAEAMTLRDKSETILSELGIERGRGEGKGMGMGFGGKHGGRGMMGNR